MLHTPDSVVDPRAFWEVQKSHPSHSPWSRLVLEPVLKFCVRNLSMEDKYELLRLEVCLWSFDY